jgi:predicted ATP-grasp superfamily ATP-dependent carboligase
VSLDVLVLDAHQRQALVCVRALGRAGLRVGALDVKARAPAFNSRWCRRSQVVPSYVSDPEAFVNAVADAALSTGARAVLPLHDGAIDAIRRYRASLDGIGLALASERALDIAISKARTLELARSLGVPVPESVEVTSVRDARSAIAHVGLPAVVKPIESWVDNTQRGVRLVSSAVLDANGGERAVAAITDVGGAAIVQQWLGGRREAISLVRARGRIWARFAQVAHRMLPPLGGASVLRESIPPPADAARHAEQLVTAADLDGYSEIEFRRDAHGVARLMEINPRLSASVEVAVRSGVDFPSLIYGWAASMPLEEVHGYRTAVRMRWLGGDIHWLRATMSSQGQPDVLPVRDAVRWLARDAFRPTSHDYVDLEDLQPALVATGSFLGWAARSTVARLRARLTRRFD